MGTATLSQSAIVEIDGTRHTLRRKIGTRWQLEDEFTGEISNREETELLGRIEKQTLVFPSENDSVDFDKRCIEQSSEAWEQAKLRNAYVRAALQSPTRKTLVDSIRVVWEQLGKPANVPSVVSVYRWKKRYIASGRDARALMDNIAKRGNRNSRYLKETLDICTEAICAIYMRPERRTVQDTWKHAVLQVDRKNRTLPNELALARPTRRLVAGIISRMPEFDKHAARYSQLSANHKFRSVLGSHTTFGPLQRAEIDHTILDLFVVDDEKSLAMGRPTVTACIDVYTRCILGIHISFGTMNYLAVAKCLKHALLPKVSLRNDYPAIRHDWTAHGVMRELVVDNGFEFHSESLDRACLSEGIVLTYSPRKQPWFKGKIERFFSELNKKTAHPYPGTTFSNIFEKGDYDPSKHAVVTYAHLKEIVFGWITDVYHQMPHSALGTSPAHMWSTSMKNEVISYPRSIKDLDKILGRVDSRVLTHKGIELDSLFYNSEELTQLRHRKGNGIRVDLRIDDSDIGHLFVIDPDTSDAYKVPALRIDYAQGLSRWQHTQIKRCAATAFSLPDDVDGYLEAEARLVALVEEDMNLQKRRTRKRQARFREDRSSKLQKRLPDEPSQPAQVIRQAPMPGTNSPVTTRADEISSKSNRGREVQAVGIRPPLLVTRKGGPSR